jgi:TatD family-associated radical SAM protein
MTEPPAPAGTIAYRGPGGSIYLNITNRCSSSCEFCLREWTDGVYGERLVLDREPEVDEVTQAVELAFLDGPADEVVFCGFGEPTMRLDVVLAVTEWLRLRRLRSRLDTNGHGQLLNPDVDVPTALAAAGLTAVTVSLNAADPESYERVCRPVFSKSYRAVLRFAEQCVEHGIETILTAVDYPGADLPGVADLAAAMGASFRARGYAAPRGREPAGKGDH